MTNQEAFDTVARWLLRDGFTKSETRDTDGVIWCVYRAPNGNKCAIGVLLPDSEYTPDMENKTPADFERRGCIPESLLGLDTDFLNSLQECHDSDWDSHRAGRAEKLKKIAESYDLSAEVVDEMMALDYEDGDPKGNDNE